MHSLEGVTTTEHTHSISLVAAPERDSCLHISECHSKLAWW